MDYRVKVIIAGKEVFEQQDVNSVLPSITNIKLKNSTSLDAVGIGQTASDSLYFTMINPFRESFDGEKVELYISDDGAEINESQAEIEDRVGSETADSAIDDSDIVDLDDDSEEEGEDLTEEDEELSDEEETEDINSFYDLQNGEELGEESVDTDEEQEEEWKRIGVYYVYSQTLADDEEGSTRLSCLDGMIFLNDDFIPTNRTGTVQDLYDDFRAQVLENTGVIVDEFDFDDVFNNEIEWMLQLSYRDSMGLFAGLVGGYATFDADDTLGISFYGFSDYILLDTDVISYKDNSSGELQIDGMKCDTSVNLFDQTFLEVGVTDTVSFANPYVTQESLEAIFERYRGIRYVGANLVAYWKDGIDSGEFIRLMSSAEYENYLMLNNALEIETDPAEIVRLKGEINSVGKVILISNQTVDFTGDATTVIDSICQSVAEKAGMIERETYRMFKNLYAEKIKADKIDVDDLFAQEVTAKKMRIESDSSGNKVVIDANSNRVIEVITSSASDDSANALYVGRSGKVVGETICRNTDRVTETTIYENAHNYGTRIVTGYITSSAKELSFMIPFGLRSQYENIKFLQMDIVGRCNGEYVIGTSSSTPTIYSGDGGTTVDVGGTRAKVYITEMKLTPDKDFVIIKLRAKTVSGSSDVNFTSENNNAAVAVRLNNIRITHRNTISSDYNEDGSLKGW